MEPERSSTSRMLIPQIWRVGSLFRTLMNGEPLFEPLGFCVGVQLFGLALLLVCG